MAMQWLGNMNDGRSSFEKALGGAQALGQMISSLKEQQQRGKILELELERGKIDLELMKEEMTPEAIARRNELRRHDLTRARQSVIGQALTNIRTAQLMRFDRSAERRAAELHEEGKTTRARAARIEQERLKREEEVHGWQRAFFENNREAMEQLKEDVSAMSTVLTSTFGPDLPKAAVDAMATVRTGEILNQFANIAMNIKQLKNQNDARAEMLAAQKDVKFSNVVSTLADMAKSGLEITPNMAGGALAMAGIEPDDPRAQFFYSLVSPGRRTDLKSIYESYTSGDAEGAFQLWRQMNNLKPDIQFDINNPDKKKTHYIDQNREVHMAAFRAAMEQYGRQREEMKQFEQRTGRTKDGTPVTISDEDRKAMMNPPRVVFRILTKDEDVKHLKKGDWVIYKGKRHYFNGTHLIPEG